MRPRVTLASLTRLRMAGFNVRVHQLCASARNSGQSYAPAYSGYNARVRSSCGQIARDLRGAMRARSEDACIAPARLRDAPARSETVRARVPRFMMLACAHREFPPQRRIYTSEKHTLDSAKTP